MTGRKRDAICWTLIAVTELVLFIVIEARALAQSDPDGGMTLSRFVYEISKGWRPIIFILGFVTGLLAEHFWRHVDGGINPWPNLPPWLRWLGIGIGWSLVVLLTGGGPAIFLIGLPIGMAVTNLLWVWNPEDANDHRG